MILLAAIPILVYSFLLLALFQIQGHLPFRQLILRAALLNTAYLVLVLEILSPISGITFPALVFAWLIPLFTLLGWFASRRRQGKRLAFPRLTWSAGLLEWFLILITLLVLGITFLVAWIAPPQTWDSLTYHFSRIAHWAQNQSIGHYATGIERQNSISPGAEMISLNYYVITQGDRLANFPQWFAMLGSLIGVSLLASRLGTKPFGQWLAVVFAVTIPIGLAESTNTINDYLVAFWMVCVALECVTYWVSSDKQSLLYMSMAAGFAILTKLTAVPFIIPFAVWAALMLLKRIGVWGTLKWAVAAGAVVVVINLGFVSRNLVTYHSLSNPVDFQVHTNQMRDWRGLISLLIKHGGLHAGLPGLPRYNDQLDLLVLKVHVKLGIDRMDPRTTSDGVFVVHPPSTNEDLTTNPFHAYLILCTFLIMLPFWKRVGWITVLYAGVVASTFVLFSFTYKWNPFSGRYHLPFFVLFAPVIGALYGQLRWKLIGMVMGICLVVTSWNWIVSIDNRPLIPEPGRAKPQSILAVPRDLLYFSGNEWVYGIYTQLTGQILAQDCRQVGIMLNGDDPEYWVWVMLGAPRPDLDIQWIVTGTPSERYNPAVFQPCAVVCVDCPPKKPIRGLPLFMQYENNLQLFMEH